MRNDSTKMVVVLAFLSLLSAVVLASFDMATAPAIAENKVKELEAAVLKVLPQAERYEDYTTSVPVATGESAAAVYKGIGPSGEEAGVAFVAEGPGFQGVIRIMVGLDPEQRKITGIKVLEQLETPGLGARIAEDWFMEQFAGKNIDDAFVAKKDVDAITGATISSTAVANIVKQGVEKTMTMLEGGAQ